MDEARENEFHAARMYAEQAKERYYTARKEELDQISVRISEVERKIELGQKPFLLRFATLEAERDEARIEICKKAEDHPENKTAMNPESAIEHARRRGWEYLCKFLGETK